MVKRNFLYSGTAFVIAGLSTGVGLYLTATRPVTDRYFNIYGDLFGAGVFFFVVALALMVKKK